MTQSKKYAVTGGIGSGKTAVCGILKEFGYPVFSCDEISRALWKDKAYLEALKALFPSCIKEGEPDKTAISALVFSDEAARRKIEAFSHPRIMEELFAQMNAHAVSFAEVPLLFEGGYEKLFDGVLAVERKEDLRICSVMARDGLSEEAISRRIAAQLPDEERRKKGVICIGNNGSKEELRLFVKNALSLLGL